MSELFIIVLYMYVQPPIHKPQVMHENAVTVVDEWKDADRQSEWRR